MSISIDNVIDNVIEINEFASMALGGYENGLP